MRNKKNRLSKCIHKCIKHVLISTYIRSNGAVMIQWTIRKHLYFLKDKQQKLRNNDRNTYINRHQLVCLTTGLYKRTYILLESLSSRISRSTAHHNTVADFRRDIITIVTKNLTTTSVILCMCICCFLFIVSQYCAGIMSIW